MSHLENRSVPETRASFRRLKSSTARFYYSHLKMSNNTWDCVDFVVGFVIVSNFVSGILIFIIGLMSIKEFHCNVYTVAIFLGGVFVVLMAGLLLTGRLIKSSKLVLTYLVVDFAGSGAALGLLTAWTILNTGFLILSLVCMAGVLLQDAVLYFVCLLYKRLRDAELNASLRIIGK